MTTPKPVVVGSKYNLLTVVKEAEPYIQPNGRSRRKVEVSCDCGNTVQVMLENLYAGYSKSCGCIWDKAMFKHGMSHTAFKECHVNMKARCDNPNHPSYPNYGARGITYCEKWNRLTGFIDDMLDGYVEGLTLDRINVNGDYCKENCRWTDTGVQGHNKRKKSGCIFTQIGVRYNNKKTRYVASICIEGKDMYLATFDSAEDAGKGYDDASYNLYSDRPNKTEPSLDHIYKTIISKLKVEGMHKELPSIECELEVCH